MINHEDDDDCCAALNYGFAYDVKWKCTVDLWVLVASKSHPVGKFPNRDLMLVLSTIFYRDLRREKKETKEDFNNYKK